MNAEQRRHRRDFEHADSREIRARIDETRAQMDATVDELAHRLKPRTLLEELAAIADLDSDSGARMRERASAFGRRFVEQIEANPIPAALIGAGMAWLALGSREPRPTHDRSSDASRWRKARMRASRGWDELHESASAAGAHLKDTASSARERLHSASESLSEHARDAGASLRERTSRLGDEVRHGYRRTRDTVTRTWNDAPLAIGAGALALGALFGALAPETRAEDRAMGPAAEKARRRVRDAAERAKQTGEELAGRARAVAGKAADAARTTAEEQTARQEHDLRTGDGR